MVLSGCTQKESNSEKVLNIHFPPVNLNLDPQKMEDAYSMTVVLQIHRGLLRYTPSGDVAPDLVERWSESSDHKIYSFKLNPAKFSNGQPITTTHVRMSFARLFFIGAAMSADLDYIEGASEFKKSGDIQKLGIFEKSPTDIEFHLKHPSALFLKHLAVADCAILPITDFKESINFGTKTPYAGPYRVTAIDKDKGVTIEKWRSDVLQSKNPPQTVNFFLTEQNPIELANLGKTDSLDHDTVKEEEFKKLLSRGWQETATELISESYMIMNPKRVQKEIRAAIFSAVDQRELSKELGPKFIPAFGVIPRGLPGELEENDIKGFRTTKKVTGKITIQLDPKNEIQTKVFAYLKPRLESIGIEVKKEELSKREILAKIFKRDCDVCLGSKGLDYPDGLSVLNYFKSGYDYNYFYLNSPTVDALLGEAGKILEKDRREAQYKEIQKKILAEYTVVPLVFGSSASGLWSEKIQKMPPHIMGYHMLPVETIEMK